MHFSCTTCITTNLWFISPTGSSWTYSVSCNSIFIRVSYFKAKVPILARHIFIWVHCWIAKLLFSYELAGFCSKLLLMVLIYNSPLVLSWLSFTFTSIRSWIVHKSKLTSLELFFCQHLIPFVQSSAVLETFFHQYSILLVKNSPVLEF